MILFDLIRGLAVGLVRRYRLLRVKKKYSAQLLEEEFL